MGILGSLSPWIVYWLLVGDVPFRISAILALMVAVAAFAVDRSAAAGRGLSGGVLEIGAVATFLVVTGASFTAAQPDAQHWLLVLSFAGIFIAALASLLMGRPFVRRYLTVGLPADVVKTELFGRVVTLVSWMWVAVFAAMTVSASIPAVIDPDSTIFDMQSPLSYICYWVVPTALFAAAALLSTVLPDRMMAGIDDLVRSTTFVAFAEADIDQLLYLAQEHASKEVGPGKEAYNVRIGSKGTPLVGDDTRQSWPSTYKVREKRR